MNGKNYIKKKGHNHADGADYSSSSAWLELQNMNNLKIELLADHPEALPILKELFKTEWGPYYGKEGPGDAETDLKSSANHTELPIAIVAFIDGKVCGTAALKMGANIFLYALSGQPKELP